MRSTRHNRSRFSAALGLGMLVMLAMQVLEAGHLHNTAAQSPDCVYCQVGSLVAVVSTSAELAFLATSTLAVLGVVQAAPEIQLLAATARGPPNFSS